MTSVGLLTVDFHISESFSLKQKRAVLKSIRERVRGKFNVSIAEVDNHDKWQLATFAISCVAGSKKQVNSIMDNVRDFFIRERSVIVQDYRLEII